MTVSALLREPLTHFFAAGLLVFMAYGAVRTHAPEEAVSTAPRQVELTLGDLQQLELTFAARWQRAPTADEMVRLVEDRMREEVLYREALALGLDQDDAIVRRRLAQKMEFLSEDSAAREPTRADLEAWFVANAESFERPARVTFLHRYFSPDVRGSQAQADAAAAAAALAGAAQGDADEVGDPYMFQDYLVNRSPEQLAKAFGPAFAQSVLALEPGNWQGPIESGYGWHVVFVTERTESRVPSLDEVLPEAKAAWLADRRREALADAYERMRAKYELVLPAPSAAAVSSAGPEGHDGQAEGDAG